MTTKQMKHTKDAERKVERFIRGEKETRWAPIAWDYLEEGDRIRVVDLDGKPEEDEWIVEQRLPGGTGVIAKPHNERAWVIEKARDLYNIYNESEPNPWKTFDGRDVPKYGDVSDQVRAKWEAVAKATLFPFWNAPT